MGNFEGSFAEDGHSHNKNVCQISNDNWHIIGGCEENLYLLPGHELEAYSKIPQKVVYDH